MKRKHKITWSSVFIIAVLAGLVFGGNGPQPAVGLYWYNNTDPQVGPGMAAPLNQLLVRTDAPSLYYKSGTSNTAWTKIGTGTAGGGTITSITCGAGLLCTPANPIVASGTITSVPIQVDLTRAPYNVVANSTGAAAANMAGIKQAIADWGSGLHAKLILPPGIVYVGQDGINKWSINFPSSATDLDLAGYGMFSTELAQFGPGTGGEWDLIVVNGTRIELEEFGVYQDTITTPDPGQQNHLIAVYDNSTDVYGHNLYFGKSIGDQLRWLGAVSPATNIHFTEVLFKGAGTVTSAPPNGRTGSRSGLAVQRNCNNCELDNFYMDGQQNSQIDEEPTGGASSYLHIHDGIANNLLSNTSSSTSIGGESGGAIDIHQRIENLQVWGGAVIIAQTNDLQIDGLFVQSSAAYPADIHTASIAARQVNSDMQLRNVRIERTGTSGSGIGLDIEDLGGSRTIIDGLQVYQTTTALPIMMDAVANLQMTNVKVRYEGASPGSFDAIEFFAVDGSCDNPQIDNVQVTSTGTMHAAIYIAVRTPRTMNNIEIHNVSTANATTCVQTSLGAGGTLDATPVLEGISCSGNAAWLSGNAGDNPVTTLYPIVAGDRGLTATAPIYEGTAATPEGALTAIQGAIYTYLGGAGTARFWKSTGTGNTGWVGQMPNLLVPGTLDVAGLIGSTTQAVFGSNGLEITTFSGAAATPAIRSFVGDPNGTVTGPVGSILMDTSGPFLWQNTNGATAWSKIGGSTIVQSVYYGDGTDGTCTFDGVATPVCGGTLSGSTYTLQRDIAANNMSVSAGVTVRSDNWRVFVFGTLSGGGAGATVMSNGFNATGRIGGNGAGFNTRFYPACSGSGGSGANGTGAGGAGAGNSVAIPQWPAQAASAAGANGAGHGQGGGGGTTAGDAGGTGGAIANPSVNAGYFTAVGGFAGHPDGTGATWSLCGTGGGGGGVDGGSSTGGGGGGGGAILYMGANQCTGTILIASKGGNGASGTPVDGTGTGGGAGGGGGIITFIYSHRAAGCTTSVAGGTGAAGTGTGAAGGNGSTGTVQTYNLSGDGT